MSVEVRSEFSECLRDISTSREHRTTRKYSHIFDINFELRHFENKFNEIDKKPEKFLPKVSIEVELATKFSEGQGKISISGKCT